MTIVGAAELVARDSVGKLDGEENEGIRLLGQLVGIPVGTELGTLDGT